ncbi:LysR family transcriptional regulator [Streptomyces aidingensis]|uniref:DNA-binding transcriptional regulator, LysR family n=1 Tax=Streptomyces aidingensis TaxID=910347 RepID=A0A1I1T5W6_9ACTN|nr:LysR family transcriptional regulator [Streptomyces aidingensis]SFD54015.1 DNA-binding transcriptional regulator, LysR family [Streptomyces aidingensis]
MPGRDNGGPAVDLGDLRLFAVVAEELHFGRAAARLHLSQPGLSYRVKALEDALGYQVLARNRRGVRLTPAGEVLLSGARRLLGEAHRVVDDGGRVARGELATVRVGFVGTALYSLLPAVLREARVRHPALQVRVEERKSADQVRLLQLGRLDLGLLHLPVDPRSGLEATPVLEDPVGIALPAGHRLADRDPLALADLSGEDFVLFPRDLEPHTYDRYTDACVAAGFAPRVAHEATGLQTILALVAAGLGVAFAARSVARHLTRSGVVFRPLAGPAPRLVTGPARPAGSDHPGAALLREVILDCAGDRTGKSQEQEFVLDG